MSGQVMAGFVVGPVIRILPSLTSIAQPAASWGLLSR